MDTSSTNVSIARQRNWKRWEFCSSWTLACTTEILTLLKQNSTYFSKAIIWLFEFWIWRLVCFVPRICEGGRNPTPPHQALCDWFFWADRAGWSSSWHGHTGHSHPCCQPWPDTFVFEREAAPGWMLPRTVGDWFLRFLILIRLTKTFLEHQSKGLMMLGRALKRPLFFYPSGIFKFIC